MNLQATVYLLMFVVFWICWSLYKTRPHFKFSKNYKGFKFFPIIGSFLQVIYCRLDTFGICSYWTDKFGDCYNIWAGHKYVYISADIEDAKNVLNSSNGLDKAFYYDKFHLFFGGTLLVIPGHDWKPRRKEYARSFKQSILNTFTPNFFKNSGLLVKELPDVNQTGLLLLTERFSFRNIYENLMNQEVSLKLDEIDTFIKQVGSIQDVINSYLICGIFPIYFCDLLLHGPTRRIWLNRTLKFIHEKIINFKMRDSQIDADTSDINVDLLDTLLNSSDKLTENILTKEIFLFISAASDTTAGTLAFTLTLLGMNTAAQNRAFDEVMSEIGSKNPIVVDDLPKLKYIERVILESLRLFPSVIVIGRKLTADIKSGKKIIPKDTNILINIHKIHRNENYWPNPLKFDPDRFLPEEIAKRPIYCYLPFSGGPRNCIGKVYAMMSLKVAVSNVIRNYKISSNYKSVDDIKITSGISSKSIHPLDCQFTPRS